MAENIFLSPKTQNAISDAVKDRIDKTMRGVDIAFEETIRKASDATLRKMADTPGLRKNSPLMSNWTVRTGEIKPFKFNAAKQQVWLEGAELKNARNSILQGYATQINEQAEKALRKDVFEKILGKQTVIAKTGTARVEQATQLQETAKKSMTFERTQMWLMLINGVTQSITQGFERSAAIAESMYKEMANRAISQGNWNEFIAAKRNELFTQQKSAGGDYAKKLITGGAKTVLYTSLAGPVGTVAGVLETGLDLFSTNKQQQAEREKILEEINYRRRRIYSQAGSSTASALQSIKEENELADLKKQLSDTNNKAAYYVKLQIVETEKANKELEQQLADLKVRIDRLKQQSGNEVLLLDAEKESANLIQQRVNNIAKIKQFTALDQAYEKQEAAKEALREKEEEQARLYEETNAAARIAGHRYFSDLALQATTERFAEFQNRLMEQHGVEVGGELAWQYDEQGKLPTAAQEYADQITVVQERLKESYDKFNILKGKLDENIATADEVKALLDLDKAIKQDQETLKNAQDMINGVPQLEYFKEQSKAMVDQMSRQIQSSSFMSDNLGSFNQYFGRTDSSINLISETNGLLKNILTAIENVPKDLCLVSTYQ